MTNKHRKLLKLIDNCDKILTEEKSVIGRNFIDLSLIWMKQQSEETVYFVSYKLRRRNDAVIELKRDGEIDVMSFLFWQK